MFESHTGRRRPWTTEDYRNGQKVATAIQSTRRPSPGQELETSGMRLLMIVCVLALLLEGCMAKRDIDECNKGDRSRCPQDASLS